MGEVVSDFGFTNRLAVAQFESLGAFTHALDLTRYQSNLADITVKHLVDGALHGHIWRHGQEFPFRGKSLAFDARQEHLKMPPNWEHFPVHDHAVDNEEELYIPLEGSGTLARSKTKDRLIRCSGAS